MGTPKGVRKSAVIGAVLAAFSSAVAFAQSSTHYKTWPEALRQVEQSATIPPGWKPIAAAAAPMILPPNPLTRPIVINFGRGGIIAEHRKQFAIYKDRKAKVEVRGPCYSACTLLLAYVEPDRLCIAEGAFMAFHAVRSMEHGEHMVGATYQLYYDMPAVIRTWIDHAGGWQNLPLNGYWTMRDRELWAMGYPKCQ